MDLDVVIPRPNIHLSEVLHVVKLGDKSQGKGKWIGILYRPIIDVLVILTRSEFSALLSNEEEATHLRRF
jgi:hypothetical protein